MLFANVLAFIVDHISTAVQWACMWLKFAQLVVAWTRKVVHWLWHSCYCCCCCWIAGGSHWEGGGQRALHSGGGPNSKVCYFSANEGWPGKKKRAQLGKSRLFVKHFVCVWSLPPLILLFMCFLPQLPSLCLPGTASYCFATLLSLTLRRKHPLCFTTFWSSLLEIILWRIE